MLFKRKQTWNTGKSEKNQEVDHLQYGGYSIGQVRLP